MPERILAFLSSVITFLSEIRGYPLNSRPIINWGNLVLSTELITLIGRRKELKSCRDEGLTLETSAFKLITVANLRY